MLRRCNQQRLAFAGSGHILYGSDFPYVSTAIVASFTGKLDDYGAPKRRSARPGQFRVMAHAVAAALV